MFGFHQGRDLTSERVGVDDSEPGVYDEEVVVDDVLPTNPIGAKQAKDLRSGNFTSWIQNVGAPVGKPRVEHIVGN